MSNMLLDPKYTILPEKHIAIVSLPSSQHTKHRSLGAETFIFEIQSCNASGLS